MKRTLLVTAGPTRERIDPVRFISNYSTGTFGYAIAREARRRGFRVTLVSGPVHLVPPPGVKVINVETALEMRDAVRREFKKHSLLIMASAVSDWRVIDSPRSKIKRTGRPPRLRLISNPDIVKEAAAVKGDKVVVGFALETDGLRKNALGKLKEKKLDIIVANRFKNGRNVFGDGHKDILLIDRNGKAETFKNKTKKTLAKIILDRALGFKL